MLFSDFQEARTAAQRAAQETGQSVTLTRQGDGWVVEVPEALIPVETSPPEGEIPWDGGVAVDPDDDIPF